MPTRSYSNKDLNGPNPTRFSNWPREFPTEDDQPAKTREQLIAESFRPVDVQYGPDSPYGDKPFNETLADLQQGVRDAQAFDDSIQPAGDELPHPTDEGVLARSQRQPSVTDSIAGRFGKMINDFRYRHSRAMSGEAPSPLSSVVQNATGMVPEQALSAVARGLATAAGTAGVSGMFPAIASSDLISGGKERLMEHPGVSAIDAAVALSPAFGAVNNYVKGAQEAETVAAEGAARQAESATRAGQHAKARYNARQAESAGFPRSSVQEGLAGDEPVGGNYLHPKAPRSISRDISNPVYEDVSGVNDLGQSPATAARYPSMSKPAGGYPEPRSIVELRNALANDPERAAAAFAPYGRGIGMASEGPLEGGNVNWPAMGRGPQPPSPAGMGAGFSSGTPEGMGIGIGRSQQIRGLMDALKKPVDPIESAIEASGVHRPVEDIMAQKEAFDMGGFAGPQIKRGLGQTTPDQAALYSKALRKMEGSTGDVAENLAAKIKERPRSAPSYSEESGPFIESRAKNASGGGNEGSLEQSKRNAGMKSAGQKFVVKRRNGQFEDVVGNPEDFNPRPGEQYGKMVNGKFQLLTKGEAIKGRR